MATPTPMTVTLRVEGFDEIKAALETAGKSINGVRQWPRVYLAGPMRGYTLFNFPAFDVYAARLRAKGFDVISPADLDREMGFDPETSVPDQAFMRRALARDCAEICQCDAIALMPGWQDSRGAEVEFKLANLLGLAIIDATNGNLLWSGKAA